MLGNDDPQPATTPTTSPTNLLPGTDPDDLDLVWTVLNDPLADPLLKDTEKLPAAPKSDDDD